MGSSVFTSIEGFVPPEVPPPVVQGSKDRVAQVQQLLLLEPCRALPPPPTSSPGAKWARERQLLGSW